MATLIRRRLVSSAVPAFCIGLCIGGCSAPPEPQRPNLVVMMIDTLRPDHLGSYGYRRPTSPHIDRLAARGVLFRNTVSVAAYTRAATASLFTGLYPSVHGAVSTHDSIAEGVPTLAEILKASGYQTLGLHLNGNVAATFGFNRGFDFYDSANREYRKHRGKLADDEGKPPWMLDDSAISWQVPSLLDELEAAPFLLYLHFIGPHAPYAPPKNATTFVEGRLTDTAERFYERPEKGPKGRNVALINEMIKGRVPVDELTRRQIVDLYDGEIAFTDAQVGAVLASLEERSLLDNTVVVVTSDHGEEFWEHGGMSHGHSHYEELLRIPFLVAGPGIQEGKVIATPTSLIDIAPTLLELAGLEPSQGLPGRSLAHSLRRRRSEPAERPRYAEGLLRFDDTGRAAGFFRSLHQGSSKLIIDGRKRIKYLFDLEADPGELVNQLDTTTGQADGRDLMETLVGLHEQNLSSGYLDSGSTADIPEELEDQLLALGYLSGNKDVESRPVFRRPLRSRVDMRPYGFVGDESNVGDYESRLDLEAESSAESEQFLYGWRQSRGSVLMRRRAGVRLRRDLDHRSWRLTFRLPRSAGAKAAVKLAVKVDGGDSEEFRVTRDSGASIGGPLSDAYRRFTRLDFECLDSPSLRQFGPLEERAPCAFVTSIEVL